MSSGWASVAAATTTPSTPDARSFSGVSTASTPNRSTTELIAAGTTSVTTSEVTDGSADSVSAWKAPILPSPIKPILMATPMLKGCEQSVREADDGLAPSSQRAERFHSYQEFGLSLRTLSPVRAGVARCQPLF